MEIRLLEKLTVIQLVKKFLHLMEPEGHYRVHKDLPLVPILIQLNSVHTLPPYVPKIQSNMIFPSSLRSSTLSLPFRFPNQNTVYISHLSRQCYMLHPSHLPWFHHPKRTSYEAPHYAVLFSLPLRSKYFPQYPDLKHPQSMFFPKCERQSFTHIQNNM